MNIRPEYIWQRRDTLLGSVSSYEGSSAAGTDMHMVRQYVRNQKADEQRLDQLDLVSR